MNTYKDTTRVVLGINENGDTTITFLLSDAKFILAKLLQCEISDEIINELTIKDSLNTGLITMLKKEISLWEERSVIQEAIAQNNTEIINLRKEQTDLYKDVNNQLMLAYKTNKRAKVFSNIMFGAITVTLTTTLVFVLIK